jgi:hypothetical protein
MKTVTKLAIVAAGLAASSMLGAPAGHATGDAPWCAVIDIGAGEGFWDCRYRTVEECVPNVLADNRGTCTPNPYGGGAAAVAVPLKRHYKHHVQHG